MPANNPTNDATPRIHVTNNGFFNINNDGRDMNFDSIPIPPTNNNNAAYHSQIHESISSRMIGDFKDDILPILRSQFTRRQKASYYVSTPMFLMVLRHFLSNPDNELLCFIPVQYTEYDHHYMRYHRLKRFYNELYLVCCFLKKDTSSGDEKLVVNSQIGYFALCNLHFVLPIAPNHCEKLHQNYIENIQPILPKKDNTLRIMMTRDELYAYTQKGAEYGRLPAYFVLNWAVTLGRNPLIDIALDHNITNLSHLRKANTSLHVMSDIRIKNMIQDYADVKRKNLKTKTNFGHTSQRKASTPDDGGGSLTFTWDAKDEQNKDISELSSYDLNGLCPPKCDDHEVV